MGTQVLISKQNCSFFLKIIFVLANSVDPDEIPHYAAFNQSGSSLSAVVITNKICIYSSFN